MGYSSEDKAGRKGIETVCRVCQTNGAGPCGKEIIIGSVSVKHVNTIQKRKGGGEAWGARGGAAASEGPRGPGLSAATLALPKNVCNPQADWGDPVALPGNAAGFPIVSNAQRGQGGSQREERGGRRRGTGEVVSLFQPSLMRAPCHCPKITIALFWSFVHSCWQWLLTKQLDMERIWPPPLPSLPPPVFFFFVIFGGPPWTREEASPRFTCSIRLKKGVWGGLYEKGRQRGAGALALTKKAEDTMSRRES